MPVELVSREYVHSAEALVSLERPEAEKSQEDKIFAAEVNNLNNWLLFRVKNELVLQIYKGASLTEGTIDYGAVARVLEGELLEERNRHFDDEMKLNLEIIPKAELNHNSPKGPDDFTVEDIPQLYDAEELHHKMAWYIQGIESSGDGWSQDLAKAYVEQAYDKAVDEFDRTVAA